LEERLQDARRRGGRLLAPSILASEVGAAITKSFRMRRMTRFEAEAAFENWRQLIAVDLFDLVDANDLLGEAFQYSIRLHHALHDCLYLVLARKERAAFLTADEVFARKAISEGVTAELLT
jgi:predicted nucleic acid-binding protein